MSHAKLSPSSSRRWLSCGGSVPLIEAAIAEALRLGMAPLDESSEYADEGSAAHVLGGDCLAQGYEAASDIGRVIDVCNDDGTVRRSFTVDDDMASYVQVYVDRVRDSLHEGAQLLVEQQVDTGLESVHYGKVTGTGDAIILAPLFALIEVHDLKYGKGIKVDALTALTEPKDAFGPIVIDTEGRMWELNPQLALYGLGAVRDYGLLGGFELARLVIHQPRLDHLSIAEIPVADLLAWGEAVRAYISALDERVSLGIQPELRPSESACKWCPVKATCPALDTFVSSTVLDEFKDLADITEYGTAQAYERTPLVRQWLEAVEARSRALCERGELPGYVLDVGRQGDRKWKDAEVVEELFKKRYRLKRDEMYKSKVISPTDAEKLFAKANPQRWEDLQEQITRGAPSTKIVRASEAKNPLPVTNVADDFANLLGI